jgi:hypothetical protein
MEAAGRGELWTIGRIALRTGDTERFEGFLAHGCENLKAIVSQRPASTNESVLTNGVKIGPGQMALTRIPFSLTIWFDNAPTREQE